MLGTQKNAICTYARSIIGVEAIRFQPSDAHGMLTELWAQGFVGGVRPQVKSGHICANVIYGNISIQCEGFV